ncbi:MAG TPA: Flp pilus assembly protein CpaB [Chloroflexia bacterium]|nr:Flp pilus assembly protein CpaB [Chloroflexia bacterium]
MKARGGRFLLILGAGLAALAFVVVYVVMSRGVTGGDTPSAAVPQTTYVPLAVVSVDVPAYTILDASNLTTTEVEASTVATNTTSSPATVMGQMTLVPLTKGQPVRTDQLTQTGFSNILAKGERAFALAVPERSTFGNAVTENDRIDLLWTAILEYDSEHPEPEGRVRYEKSYYTSTKTLLQNIHVMRVIQLRQAPAAGQNQQGQDVEQTAATTAATNTSAMYAPDAPVSTVLVLGVTDQQAEVIKFARENGIIDLTLRSSALQKDDQGNVLKDEAGKEIRGDQDVELTTGISINILVDQYGLPIPPAAAPR